MKYDGDWSKFNLIDLLDQLGIVSAQDVNIIRILRGVTPDPLGQIFGGVRKDVYDLFDTESELKEVIEKVRN